MQEDNVNRINRLVAGFDNDIQSRFIGAVNAAKSSVLLNDLSNLLETGRFDDALRLADQIPLSVTTRVNMSFVQTGNSTSNVITAVTSVPTFFDQTNQSAVNFMRANQSRLVREFTDEQRRATTAAITDGIQRGLNPLAQARNFRDSIGLTTKQQQAVNNFRNLLETNNRQALARGLRDKRFDPTIARAIREEKDLTRRQINRMVTRYRERYVKYRSEVIGRSEALRSVHEANHQSFQQAIDAGTLQPNELERQWHTSGLPNIRDSHDVMNGQKVEFDELFVTGAGNSLRYPGDPNGEAGEVIQCRCGVSTTFKNF